MQDLYDELWRQQLSVIEPCTFSIPQPQHGLHPGYIVDLKEIDDETFPDPEFEKGKEEQGFKMLEVRSRLPCGIDQLLVRQEFEAIEHELVEIESEKWTNVNPKTKMPAVGLNLDYQIAGQPGSGKSFFLSYLLVLRILKGQPTVFHFNDRHCYLFDSDSKGSKTDADSLFDLPENQKKVLWILMDEKLEDAGWNMKGHGWFVVQAASPKKVRNLRQWQKDRKVRSHYMSNWGWGEIVAAFSLAKPKPPTAYQMAMLFTTFTCLGPIPRTCLESISMRNDNAYNHDLKTYHGHVDCEIDTFILQWGYLTVEAHPPRSAPSAGGRFFEAYAHDWFGKGRSFEADKLPVKNNNTHLKFTTCLSRGWPGALNTLILLQITIANSHPIKLHWVKNLYESLSATIKNIHIVFVILEDRISKYLSAQSAPEAGDVKLRTTDLKINQFQLVLTEETIHSMAIDGPFKVQDGGRGAGESGSRDYDGGDTAMGGTQ
ncbi:hypothetical protein L873DRAFT_1788850 [Choiromyces venosus 120613-1]|uniref:Uncharacterized protein n=1 Tax=Choiromyces venosus 120613-1 TaxID=1336337 RepID=A0A3N4JQW4_9PEZI|nr:hypothetical protein L873DRAFT_1788850 [Choiromyces venosus 120613-1]